MKHTAKYLRHPGRRMRNGAGMARMRALAGGPEVVDGARGAARRQGRGTRRLKYRFSQLMSKPIVSSVQQTMASVAIIENGSPCDWDRNMSELPDSRASGRRSNAGKWDPAAWPCRMVRRQALHKRRTPHLPIQRPALRTVLLDSGVRRGTTRARRSGPLGLAPSRRVKHAGRQLGRLRHGVRAIEVNTHSGARDGVVVQARPMGDSLGGRNPCWRCWRARILRAGRT